MHRKKVETHDSTRGYSIGEVSRIVNLSQKILRDYEKIGLLTPARQPRTNNRIYTDYEIDQIERISDLLNSQGFTLPCLIRLIQLAPCWKIFDCEMKKKCNAYLNPHEPCYTVRAERGTLCNGLCERCAVFINRSDRKETLLHRSGASSDENGR